MDETERAAWVQARAAFLETKLRNGSKHTYSAYASVLDRMFRKDFPRSPAEVTTAEIEAFVNDPAVGTGARRNRLSILKQFYVYAQERQALPGDFLPPTGAVLYRQDEPTKKRTSALLEMKQLAHLPGPWIACIRDFLSMAESRSGSRKSAQTYYYLLAHFFASGKSPDAYTKTDVIAWLNEPIRSGRNAGRPPSPNSRNSRLSLVRSFFSFASDYESDGQPLYSKALITRGLHSVKTPHAYRAMSESELARLFSVIDRSTVAGKRDFALFSFYLLSCRRLQEVAELRYGNIEETTVIDPGGGRRQARIYWFKGKGRRRIDDSAELPQLVWELLQEYWKAAQRVMTPDSPLFIPVNGQGRGHNPLGGPTIDVLFRKYLAAAGLDCSGRLSVHSLRHSSAQLRVWTGSDLPAVQKALRHSSLQTTSIYVASLTTASDPALALIEARLPFLTNEVRHGR